MALKRWYADLRNIKNEKDYLKAFSILNEVAEGGGLVPIRGGNVRVFSCLLDVEENQGILRDYVQYLSPRIPEM